MLTKAEKVYAATANALNELLTETSGPIARSEILDFAHDLVDRYKEIDPSFDQHLFLSIADPD